MAPWWPNGDYVREIPRLNAYRNVQLLGYVRAAYCNRQLSHVTDDIETYASRSTGENAYAALGVQGIFVDETVNLYTKKQKDYLDKIDSRAHGLDGIGGDKIIVHNPGTAVHAKLAAPGPDVTVVVETSYAEFVKKEYQEWLKTSPYGRSRSCYMVHSVPEGLVAGLTRALRERAEYLFVTSETIEFYSKWAVSWESFVAAVAAP